jgi:hypothetical protein
MDSEWWNNRLTHKRVEPDKSIKDGRREILGTDPDIVVSRTVSGNFGFYGWGKWRKWVRRQRSGLRSDFQGRGG